MILSKFITLQESPRKSERRSISLDIQTGILKYFNESGDMLVSVQAEGFASGFEDNVITNMNKVIEKEKVKLTFDLKQSSQQQNVFDFGLRLGTTCQKSDCCFMFVVASYVHTNGSMIYLISPPFVAGTKYNLHDQKNTSICSFTSFQFFENNHDLTRFLKDFFGHMEFLNYIIYHKVKIDYFNRSDVPRQFMEELNTKQPFSFEAASVTQNMHGSNSDRLETKLVGKINRELYYNKHEARSEAQKESVLNRSRKKNKLDLSVMKNSTFAETTADLSTGAVVTKKRAIDMESNPESLLNKRANKVCKSAAAVDVDNNKENIENQCHQSLTRCETPQNTIPIINKQSPGLKPRPENHSSTQTAVRRPFQPQSPSPFKIYSNFNIFDKKTSSAGGVSSNADSSAADPLAGSKSTIQETTYDGIYSPTNSDVDFVLGLLREEDEDLKDTEPSEYTRNNSSCDISSGCGCGGGGGGGSNSNPVVQERPAVLAVAACGYMEQCFVEDWSQ